MKSIIVGVVAAPGLPTKIINKLTDTLEKDLQENLPENVAWKVEMEINLFTGAVDTVKEIINETKQLKQTYNWDYAISLTDLPIFHGRSIVLADADAEERVGQISLPAFGMMPTVRKVKLTLFHMIKELYYSNGRLEEDVQFVDKGIGVRNPSSKTHFFDKLLNVFRFASIRREAYPEEQHNISVRFLLQPRLGGLPTILAGMTISNQPWTIMPSFKKVVGLAFATGSYMLVFTTLWKLSNLYDGLRFVLLMCFAIGGMTVWIIFAHNLWEGKKASNSNGFRHIYNASTVLTLLSSIIIFYLSLFALFLFAVIIFVPPDMFREVVNQDVSLINYLKLVWLVTSAATVAGAIGAGLEKEELVRTITYGYRQYSRFKEIEEQEQKEQKYSKNETE